MDIGRGRRAPIHRESAGAPAWWGSVFLLVADGVMLGSLLFGYAFLWVVAPNWPPPERIAPVFVLALAVILTALAGAMLARRAEAAGVTGSLVAAGRMAMMAALSQGLVIAGLVAIGVIAVPSPTTHAYAAACWVLLAYGIVHAFIALICAAFVRARIWAGFLSRARTQEFSIARPFGDYASVTTLIILVCLLAPELGR